MDSMSHYHHSPQHAFVTGVLTSSSSPVAGGAAVHRNQHHRSACSIRTGVVCANVNGGSGSARSAFHGQSTNLLRLMSAKCQAMIATSNRTNNSSNAIIPNNNSNIDVDESNNTSTAAAAAATATTINDGTKIPSSIKQPQRDDDVLMPQPRDDEDSEANVDAAINDLTPITDSNNKSNVDFENNQQLQQQQQQQQQQSELKRPPPRPRSYKQFKEESDAEVSDDDGSDQQQKQPGAAPSGYTKTGDDSRPAPRGGGGRQLSSRSMPPRSYQQHQQQHQRFNQRGGGGGYNSNNNRTTAPMEIDASATYYTRCGKCQAVYELKPDAIGPRGRKVSCSVCGNVWFQRPDRLSKLDATKEEMIDYPMDRKDNLMAEALSARNNSGYNRRGPPSNNNSSGVSVFIANLSYDITVDELRAVIAKSGVAEGAFRVTIVKDHATGKSKGYAFCDLSTERDMQLVMDHMQGMQLSGRPLSVRVGKKNPSPPNNHYSNNNNYNNSNYNNNNNANGSYNGNGYQNRQQRRPPPGGGGGGQRQPFQQ